MGKSLSLNIKTFTVENSNDNDQFMSVKFYAVSSGVNRNKSAFTEDSLQKAIPTVINKPILAFFDKNEISKDGIGDFTEHIMNVKYDPINDNTYFDTLNGERAIGIIPESSNVEVVDYLGKKFLTFTGLIWSKYNQYAVDLLNKRKKNKVSAELFVNESEFDENGIEVIHDWCLNGITLLGANVTEGIPDAHLVLSDYVQSKQFQKFKKVINFALNNDGKELIEGGENEVFHGLTSNQLRNKIDNVFSKYSYQDNELEFKQFSIDDFSENDIYVKDFQNNSYLKFNYTYENETVNVDINSKIQTEENYKPVTFSEKIEVYISKDEYGTGETIKVNTDKDAVSTKSWGEVNKTKLRNDLLKASNYKDAINKCYLKIDSDWEDHPSESLHYPVMCIENGELVYSETGLNAANQMASKENENGVVKKITSIRKKLGLLKNDQKQMSYINNKEDENLTVKEFVEKENKFKYIAECDNQVLCFNKETKKMSMIPFSKTDGEDEHIEMNMDALKVVSILAKKDDEEETFNFSEALFDCANDNDNGEAEDFAKKVEELSAANQTLAEENKKLSEDKEKLETECKTLSDEKEKLDTECKTMKEDKEKADNAVKEYKEKEMSAEVSAFAAQVNMSEDEVKEYTDKIKDFSDVTEFKKEMIFSYHEKHEDKKNVSHFIMGNHLTPTNGKKITPFDKIKNI